MSNKEQHYAYGPEHVELEAVMRLSAVKRWHMIDTTRTQTLAEHSANVALLAYVIAMGSPGMHFGPALIVSGWALMHDMPEVFIGDIPTMSKRWIDDGSLDRAERLTTPFIFQGETPLAIKHLIKICDLADGIRFIRIHGADMTSDHAQRGIEKQFWDRFCELAPAWPEEVVVHTFEKAFFYAYETRIEDAPHFVPDHAKQLVLDLARGRAGIAGSS